MASIALCSSSTRSAVILVVYYLAVINLWCLAWEEQLPAPDGTTATCTLQFNRFRWMVHCDATVILEWSERNGETGSS